MQKYLLEWQTKIAELEKQLTSIDKEKAKIKPAPGKWCVNEILGHLIDSAINNHRRFLLMQINNNLIFEGYEQDKWVELQNYIIKDLKTLIETWEILNLNIISTLLEVHPDFWEKSFAEHNLQDIAWMDFKANQAESAKGFVQDYFGHMQHHLKQIFYLGDIKYSV